MVNYYTLLVSDKELYKKIKKTAYDETFELDRPVTMVEVTERLLRKGLFKEGDISN